MYHEKEQLTREWPTGSPHARFISYVLFLLLLRKYLPTPEVAVLLWLSMLPRTSNGRAGRKA